MLKNKKILLGICGSIAAFKTIDLIRLLKKQNADVRVILTQNATLFVTTYTLQTLTENHVATDLFDETRELTMGHIELAKWADLFLVVPATADTIAKLSYGFADNLLSATWLASSAKKMIAPAMNQQMWCALVTQVNVTRLISHDVEFIGPDEGVQACGDVGLGRLVEVETICSEIERYFTGDHSATIANAETNTDINTKLSGLKVMITAGPTQEALDPVRYISNHSSGKMGYAIAQSAINAGAEVILVSGPVSLHRKNIKENPNIHLIDILTAEEMSVEVRDNINDIDIFIGCAAVADYRAETIQNKKIKKSAETLQVNLVKNPDIIKQVSELEKPPFIVGFAAETNDIQVSAQKKLTNKKMDLIVANKVGVSETGETIGFASDDNELTLIWQNTNHQEYERDGGYAKTVAIKTLDKASKVDLSKQLITEIAEHFFKRV